MVINLYKKWEIYEMIIEINFSELFNEIKFGI